MSSVSVQQVVVVVVVVVVAVVVAVVVVVVVVLVVVVLFKPPGKFPMLTKKGIFKTNPFLMFIDQLDVTTLEYVL